MKLALDESLSESLEISKLLALRKVNLAAFVDVLTEYNPIGSHEVRLNILSILICQICMEDGEVKSSRHFLL